MLDMKSCTCAAKSQVTSISSHLPFTTPNVAHGFPPEMQLSEVPRTVEGESSSDNLLVSRLLCQRPAGTDYADTSSVLVVQANWAFHIPQPTIVAVLLVRPFFPTLTMPCRQC